MTEEDFKKLQEKMEELSRRVASLEDMLLIAFRNKASQSKHSARRLKNQHDQQQVQYELFDGLAGDLDGIVSARGT